MKSVGRAALLVVVLLLLTPIPAGAQEAVELDASVGLQGYVVPWEPATVSVRVRSDVLFVGDLQVTAGGVSLFTPIEVPAGSTKDYDIDIPSVGSSNRVTVRLFVSGADEHLAQKTVTVQYPTDEILVGVYGASGIEVDLGSADSVPFSRDLAVLSLTAAQLDGDLGPLGYLVVGPGTLAGADPEMIESIADWVRDGGRVIGEGGEIAAIGSGDWVTFNDAMSIASMGAGELIAVADMSAVSAWDDAIRDTPPLTFANADMMNDVGFQLFQAATSGGESVTPGIPWLLAALTVYAVLVGPVNFFILRRLNRRDLAWVTIPVLSLLSLVLLWAAGQSHADSRTVINASLVVQDDGVSRARSAMVVVAGEGGEHSLDTPEGWSLAPFDTSMMFGGNSGVEAEVGPAPAGGTRLTFDMPDLGAATLTASWTPEPLAIAASVEADGDNLALTVANNSPIEFWAWGIGYSGSARAAAGALGAGQSDTVTLSSNAGFMEGGSAIGDAVMSRANGFWDETDWQKVWPLAETAAREEAAALSAGPYFFGYTDDLTADVTVDGHDEEAHGPSLVIIPIDLPDGVAADRGGARIVRVVGADWVDWYPGWLYASGADALEFRFEVDPAAGGEAKVTAQGGQLPSVATFEVFNWTSGEFDEYGWRDAFPLADHVSPLGELMARIVFEPAEWSDLNLADNSLTLSMEAS